MRDPHTIEGIALTIDGDFAELQGPDREAVLDLAREVYEHHVHYTLQQRAEVEALRGERCVLRERADELKDMLDMRGTQIARLLVEAEEAREERDRLRRTLAVEQGDESAAPEGWSRDNDGGWYKHTRIVPMFGGWWDRMLTLEVYPTALEAMLAADAARDEGVTRG